MPDISNKSFRELFELILQAKEAGALTKQILLEHNNIRNFDEVFQQYIKGAAKHHAEQWLALSLTLMGILSKILMMDDIVLFLYTRIFKKSWYAIESSLDDSAAIVKTMQDLDAYNKVLMITIDRNTRFCRY